MFTLHPQLEKDCIALGTLSLCRVLLMDNRLFPWLLLVPERTAVKEILDLPQPDQPLLFEEILAASRFLKEEFKPDKLNVATLGNQVPQLHVHVIARYKGDAAWPNPVWGGPREPYDAAAKEKMMQLFAKLV